VIRRADAICAFAVRGRLMPFAANTRCTNPEQSTPDLVVPPYTYLTPIHSRASASTPDRDGAVAADPLEEDAGAAERGLVARAGADEAVPDEELAAARG
jgi:hypothetical protein